MQPTYSIVGADGQTYGPVTIEELQSWIQEGRVTGDTNVSRSDHDGWFAASQFSELGLAPVAVAATPAKATAVRRAVSMPTADMLELEKKIKSGASWLFWIAGLTLVNSIVLLCGKDWAFYLGLNVTHIFNFLGQTMGGAGFAIALVLDAIAIGALMTFGILGLKKQGWAFLTAMILYGLDSLLMLLDISIIGIILHALALYAMFLGWRAAGEWNNSNAR